MTQANVIWYGHSCFMIELAGSTIVLDPYGVSSVPGLRLPDLNADAVHVSHGHTDHGAVERVLTSGKPLNFRVREVMGDHDHHSGAHRGKNRILVIEHDGLRLVHLGDQGCVLTQKQIEAIGHPDLLMLPVGGYFTIDAAEAKQIMDQLQPNVTVPIHYRDGAIGFDVLSTVDEFLALVDVPVVRSEGRQFTITEGMPRQVLIPKLVH